MLNKFKGNEELIGALEYVIVHNTYDQWHSYQVGDIETTLGLTINGRIIGFYKDNIEMEMYLDNTSYFAGIVVKYPNNVKVEYNYNRRNEVLINKKKYMIDDSEVMFALSTTNYYDAVDDIIFLCDIVFNKKRSQ